MKKELLQELEALLEQTRKINKKMKSAGFENGMNSETGLHLAFSGINKAIYIVKERITSSDLKESEKIKQVNTIVSDLADKMSIDNVTKERR